MKKNIVGYVCFGEVNTPIERLQMKHDEALAALQGAGITGIVDGGLVLPYTIVPDLSSKMAYGDPVNYLLGLFGDYSVRVDESVKAVERMHTILGDVFVGGNLIADKGFVVGTVAAG